MSPLLEVSDLRIDVAKRHGAVRVVDGASFSVAQGESLGLVGESGSGKTLTLRAILGLLPQGVRIAGGEIRFDGVDIAHASPRELRRIRGRSIAMIFQEPTAALDPVMRVGRQIAEGPEAQLRLPRARAQARASELMDLAGIADPARRAQAYPHELSGGMRQRVMIAMALASEPRLLLCDEPTTALDVTIQAQVLRLLAERRASAGTSIVYVTHDLAVVAQICERVAVMYAGRIVETGSVAEVFRWPRHPYTLGLLRAVIDFDLPRQALRSIPGTPPDPAHLPSGCPFHPRCPWALDVCTTAPVPLVDIGGGRATACIRHHELAAEPSPLPEDARA
jgi:oligopeptide/dipeptide ABC transporter ATP-binding protein